MHGRQSGREEGSRDLQRAIFSPSLAHMEPTMAQQANSVVLQHYGASLKGRSWRNWVWTPDGCPHASLP